MTGQQNQRKNWRSATKFVCSKEIANGLVQKFRAHRTSRGLSSSKLTMEVLSVETPNICTTPKPISKGFRTLHLHCRSLKIIFKLLVKTHPYQIKHNQHTRFKIIRRQLQLLQNHQQQQPPQWCNRKVDG